MHESREIGVSDEIVIGGDSVDIPNGTYPAVLTALRTESSAAFGDFRAWDFTLSEGQTVGGASSMNTGRKSKGGKWIAALLGRQPDKGETVTIIGKPCLVVVEENDDGWPKVTNVLPPMASNSTPAPAEVPLAQPAAVGTESSFAQVSEELPF
jgi:hypothetical protein